MQAIFVAPCATHSFSLEQPCSSIVADRNTQIGGSEKKSQIG